MVIRTVLMIVAAGSLFTPLMRDTNSAAEVRRGIAEYERKKPEEAAKAFESATKLRPSALTSFNYGTAQVAAGHYVEGARELTRAADDGVIRADSLYNRGNSALAANALDYAIQDYVSTLKLRPGDAAAKRNLEIALLRRNSARQRQQQQQPSQQSPEPEQDQQNQNEPNAGNQEGQQQEQADAESLLKSVEQQEREELSRMRRARPVPRRIGW